jgi:hypothetical protein
VGLVALRVRGTWAAASTITCNRCSASALFCSGLRLDDDHAFGGDALVTVRQQALLDRVGQRRGVHRKTQVHGVGDLVDVLSARTLRSDGGELDFGGIDAGHGARQCATRQGQ